MNFHQKKLINFFLDFELTLPLFKRLIENLNYIISLYVKKLLMPAVFLLIKLTKYFTT